MKLWRINLKPAGKDSKNFCFNKGIVGVGWAVDDGGRKLGKEEYERLAKQKYGNDKGKNIATNAIINRMNKDDLIWSRDDFGNYYLGKVESDWRYEPGKDFKKADIVNIRDCQWYKIGTIQSVPGKIINSFIPSSTLQAVNDRDSGLIWYSRHLFNLKSNQNYYIDMKVTQPKNPDIFSFLKSYECEDIIALYLQNKGYYFIPSTCKSDTLHYEFELINPVSGKAALTQVKNGFEVLNTEEFSGLEGEVYLFTTKGQYKGPSFPHIYCLTCSEMEHFLINNQAIIPKKVKYWLDVLEVIKE